MAERTINIAINYKINTSEVQRAQAASQAAQKATDDLRKATEQYGKASTTAHKAASTGAREASQSFTGLYNSVRLFLAAGLVREIADASINMAKLAGNTEAVGRAFRNQIPNSVALLSELRKATLGTVHDLDLMQVSLRALNFGIAVDRLPTLLKFAQIRAQQTGQSVDYLVNSIVDGLGRKSLLKLDNLQVSASRLKDEFKGVSLQTLSVAEVTEGFANVVEDELRKMGEAVENSATTADQMTVAWKNFKTELSDSSFWAGVVANLKGLAEGGTAFLRMFSFSRSFPFIEIDETLDEQARKKQIAERASISATEFMNRRLGKSKEENVKILEEEIQHLTHQLGLFAKGKEMAERTIKLNGELIRNSPYGADTHALRDNIDLQRDWIEDKQYDAEIDQQILKLLQAKLLALQKIKKEEVGDTGIVERKREELKLLQEQLEKSNQMGDLGSSGLLVLAIKEVQDQLDILLGKTKGAGDEVRQYLAGLSDQEMFQIKATLEDKAEQRAHDAEVEKDNNQRSYEHWLFYQDLKTRKQQEYADEQILIMEDNAAKAADLQRIMFELTEDLIRGSIDLGMSGRREEIDDIRKRYDEQIEIAGDNDRLKSELRLKQDRELDKAREEEKKNDQRRARTQIAIDGLVAIAKIFSQFGWPAGVVPAGIMGGITAVNIAQVGRYAKGVLNLKGPGSETSDSIPAFLSRGESVMTAEETRKNFGILSMIKNNKIDDRVLKNIDFSGGRQSFNDRRIVEVLQRVEGHFSRMTPPDIINDAGAVYQAHTDGQGNRTRRLKKIF